ncbi:MAG: hypothetical protein UT19_C0009G0023 [Candidatus Woesebacteria bacterium GW2011_GWB1_39_10b]|uniref:Uncharacterized protein n=3 Tax=Candidatus Woeseibacteriota TaxID=1752722 RepID=A0A0G0RJ22_9BACT|nr:MAG: hypothetical protein US72_C0004G0026 [Microgenomates group bacterium GW2011_GWC1_38_12]KKQ93614.1 MAG: hypothetical protein UT19_C0009G0023 [Candidatus Woesebacteria bacterium GW2011_GWB1_39_10b]KKR13612.1 MAG: hypothetical protein UT40_C0013G0013 [Candidatus Woesebacteria bacterium GW2011_GWA1_39_21b]OGM61540.1 MAG: hypothetical protein A3A52_04255 [Candidatus Woesebacteria bacterium RIFCSPLOWO2_01_FULL_39_14]
MPSLILINRTINSFLKLHFQFIIFITLNILFFFNILIFHSKVSFNGFNYNINSNHFIEDVRTEGKSFSLLNSLGQFDAQWYLKIAREGYAKISENSGESEQMAYAFFPFYPLIIRLFNSVIKDIEVSAFLISNLLVAINFFSFIYIIKKHFSYEISLKAIYILFFFPFAIFFRSYYTEGVYLVLLLWFSYFLLEKKYYKSSLFLSLLNITKASGFLLNLLFIYLAFRDFHKRKIRLSELLISAFLLFVPFMIWVYFNYHNTGSFIYFLLARSYWSPFAKFPFLSIFNNLALIFLFPFLPLHLFHFSQVDIITVFIFLLLLIKSKKILPRVYWLVSLCLWLSPLLVSDTMSFSRYQSVNFPIFIYLSQILKGKQYFIVLSIFFLLLMITSLFFVNWWWVG